VLAHPGDDGKPELLLREMLLHVANGDQAVETEIAEGETERYAGQRMPFDCRHGR
jgi:hypothetical protein